MIRPARSTDAFAIVDILIERHAETRYAGVCPIDETVARRLFAQAVQRHGGTNEGATFLLVSEDDSGSVEAFILGALSRVYGIGTKLAASDMFLIGRKDCSPRIMGQLIDGYLAWAEANPRVIEIALSWADSVPGHERVIDVYKRRGFELCAQTFRRSVEHRAMERAA